MRPLSSLLPRVARSGPADFVPAMLESLADAVVACDSDGRIVMRNRRARDFVEGFPSRPGRERLPAERWAKHHSLYYRDGSGAVAPEEGPLARALGGEDVRNVELEIRTPARPARVVNISGGPVRDSAGEIQGAVIVMQDTTDRAEIEHRLRLQSAIVENIGAGVSLVGATDGEIVYANEKWEQMFGYDPGEVIGRHVSTVSAPTTRTPEEVAQEIFDALERDGVWSGEVHNVRKDGTRFWTACSVSGFEHSEHGPVWISVSTDIAQRKATEDSLREAELRFREAFDANPLGVALVTNDLRLSDVNNVFCGIVGYRRDELEGMALADVTHPDDVDIDADLRAKVFTGEMPRYRTEKRLITKQGRAVAVQLSGSVARAPDGRVLYGITVIEEVIPTG